MAYSRVFIALKQGCQDYAKDGRGSVGRCIIEERNDSGRLILQIQGLKPEIDYRVCILTEDSYFDIDKPLYVDLSGKGEIKCEFYPKKIGMPIGNIKAVAVLVKDKAPLIGFVDEEYNWQKCLMAKDEKSVKQSFEPILEVVKEDIKSVKKEEKIENEFDKDKLVCIIDKFDKDISEIKKYSKIGTSEGIESLFEREKVDVFNEKKTSWVKANIRELCFIKPLWKYINNPFVIKSYRESGHILIGRDGENFYMAICSKYDKSYKLEAMLQGFYEVKKENGEFPKQNENCYYIVKC